MKFPITSHPKQGMNIRRLKLIFTSECLVTDIKTSNVNLPPKKQWIKISKDLFEQSETFTEMNWEELNKIVLPESLKHYE